jgi:hypothetical protein
MFNANFYAPEFVPVIADLLYTNGIIKPRGGYSVYTTFCHIRSRFKKNVIVTPETINQLINTIWARFDCYFPITISVSDSDYGTIFAHNYTQNDYDRFKLQRIQQQITSTLA